MSKTKLFLYISFVFLLAIITYSNHFNNEFHFDDSHTIQNNLFIQDIKNIPLFFKDGTSFSSLPSNQSYRPIVSTSLAIDYWLGNGYDLFYFHLSSFLTFLLQGLLMFFLIYFILEQAYHNEWNFYFSIAATAWYLFHPANAETVNYIIARSDIQSTIAVVTAFVMYMYSARSKKYYLYLIPVIVGALAKPPAVMFAPMLFVYIFLFEENLGFADIFSWTKNKKAIISCIIKSLPAFAICFIMFWFVDKMTPSAWQSGGGDKIAYLITQPFVIFHYFTTFFLPFGLSADTDWSTLESIGDKRFLFGMLFIFVLIFIAIWFSRDKRLRPISFGIIWFFLALIPSSSIVPFAEVLNDHRIYFPYVGLVISVVWTIGLLLLKWKRKSESVNFTKIVAVFSVLFLIAYAYGAYQRNNVWKTEESLWYDVTIKSPKNGRGLMNYGLSKMAQGDYKTAEKYFMDALAMWPGYSYLYVNMGVLKEATGDSQAAESYYKSGIDHSPNAPNTWFFYGRFLNNKSRFEEAIPALEKSIAFSPAQIEARHQLMKAYFNTGKTDKLTQFANETLQLMPGNAAALDYLEKIKNGVKTNFLSEEDVKKNPSYDKYIELSLQYYNSNNYQKSIDAAMEAIKLNSKSFEAYNNIGSAYNMLHQYDKAIVALKKCLEINPNFEIAKNNLNLALSSSQQPAKNDMTSDQYIDLSLSYYNQGQYEKCIEACKNALAIQPDNADAYNNMCASYNQLKQWDKAIESCNKAVQLNPNHKLANGNLNWAKTQKSQQK